MSGSNKNRKYKIPILPTILILVIIGGLLSAQFFIVKEGETAVVTRNGEFYAVRETGLYFKLPFKMDIVDKVPNSEQTVNYPEEGKYSPFLTQDKQLVDIKTEFSITIVDPKSWFYSVASPMENIMSIIRSELTDIFLHLDFADLNKNDFSGEMMNRLNAESDFNRLGVQINSFQIKSIIRLEDMADVKVIKQFMVKVAASAEQSKLNRLYREAFLNKTLNDSALNRISKEGFQW